MINQDPILITGTGRSGASIIAAVINTCGAFGGDMGKKNGMHENTTIRDIIVKPYLNRMGADSEGQFPLPKQFTIPLDWKNTIEGIMVNEGYKNGLWMYKDSRIGLTWKVWDHAFPNAKWVLVRRKTSDIVRSCTRTGFMKAFKSEKIRSELDFACEEDGWLWWVREQEKIYTEMAQKVNLMEIWPERMVQRDYKQLYEMIEWLGLAWKSEALFLIDTLLWGTHKRKEKTKWQEQLQQK